MLLASETSIQLTNALEKLIDTIYLPCTPRC